MQELKPVNVVIAGGGFVGLTMAKEITKRTSLSVVALERGQPRKTADYATAMDELDYALRFRMMQNLSEETSTHRHSPRANAVPIRQYGSFNPGTGVGGAAEHWGAICYRYYPEVFTLASYFREKYGNAKLPENLSVLDWGVTYEQLEPYYWRAEQLMGVVGKAGNLNGKRIDGGNVFEGARSHEYPLPPHKMTYITTAFEKAVRELGYHPYPVPTATLSQNYTNPDGVSRPACQYCGYCSRYGCMIGAKAQPTNILMPVLAKQKNFTLRTGCSVRRIIHKDGKAVGLSYIDANGTETLQPADIVIVASWTLNNARLLLLSKIGRALRSRHRQRDPRKESDSPGQPIDTHLYRQAAEQLHGRGRTWESASATSTARKESTAYPGVFRGGNIRMMSTGEGAIAGLRRHSSGRDQVRLGGGLEESSASLA